MKIDHRQFFYSNYVSKFRSFTSTDSEKIIKSLFVHYDYKIFPFIKNFPVNSNILELGCGEGFLLDYLRLKGFNNTFGIDISLEQIKIAKSKNLNVIQTDVFEFLRNSKNNYDIIFAFDFIEHFTKDELLELSQLIYNVLKDGGLFIIRTPNGQGIFAGSIIYGDLTHQTIFNPNSFSQLMYQSGFNKVECFENAPINKNIVGFIRKIIWESFKLIVNLIRISEIGGKTKILTQDFYAVSFK